MGITEKTGACYGHQSNSSISTGKAPRGIEASHQTEPSELQLLQGTRRERSNGYAAQYFEHGDTGSQIQMKNQDADGKSQFRCRDNRWFERTKRNTIVIAPTACAAVRLTKQYQQLGPRQYAPGSNSDFLNLSSQQPHFQRPEEWING
jgi:hypothetical protein